MVRFFFCWVYMFKTYEAYPRSYTGDGLDLNWAVFSLF